MFYREMVCDFIETTLSGDTVMIGGPGCVVEIDESCFGKRLVCLVTQAKRFNSYKNFLRKYNKGRFWGRRNCWVLGGVCRQDGRMFLAICPQGKRDRATLEAIIVAHVRPGNFNLNKDL